jgi:hypothetical protein
MQKNIPCDEPEYWLFKKLAAENQMGMKEYIHYLVKRENNGGDAK